MRVSKKSEYALRALTAICRQPRKSWAVQELAASERIPIKFLEQILLSLRHAGILASKRGVGGGYRLLRGPETIPLGEVIAIFDGPLTPVSCAGEKTTVNCSCPDPRTCALRLIMRDVRRDFATALDGRTMEDMVRLSPGAETMAFEI
jgi:Rrf2 family protein